MKSFLNDILGVLFVSGHPVGQPEHVPAVLLDDLAERTDAPVVHVFDHHRIRGFHLIHWTPRVVAG